jgi:tripartite-type tricarboxylate transporter receptor subunit TctC
MQAFRRLVPVLVVLAAVLGGASAGAQEFPSRTVKLLVPYPAGGGVDGLARAFAERLGRTWGQTVIVENKPGASTMIAGADVARASADGHTLFFTTDSSITSNPHLFKKMMYDPIKELTGVTQLIDLHQLVLVHPSVAANSLQELVALAKAQPDKLNYASYGVGSQPHLLYEMLQKEAGIRIQQVSYRGVAPALTAVIAGDVQMTLGGISVAAGHIAAGKLKPLALGRATREKTLPNVPTLREAGFPNVDPRSWFGLFAPAGTPPAVVAKISRDVAALINEPEFKARFIDGPGFTGVGSTPAEFASFIADDFAYKRNLIAVTGITAE